MIVKAICKWCGWYGEAEEEELKRLMAQHLHDKHPDRFDALVRKVKKEE
jgi:hypothetical protein